MIGHQENTGFEVLDPRFKACFVEHAGVERLWTGGRWLDVFVRDRGAGFDPGDVAEDRLGVRESIVGRMERHGGAAEVRSAPGDGTEVHLSVPLGAAVSIEAPTDGPAENRSQEVGA